MSLKEVIILGCGPSHVECKYQCETWGVNGVYTFAVDRLDKLFMTDEESEVDACYYDVLKIAQTRTTLVLPALYKKFKDSGIPIEIFPMEQLLQRFPTRFYSDTIAYMIAYALLYTKSVQGPDDLRPRVIEGYNRIYLYGIDMMCNSSYVQEKGGVEYWMGVALGMGVEVVNTHSSSTGKTWNGRMYGYYGVTEEEMLKEHLFAPWDLIRVGKAESPQDEWIKMDGEYKKIATPVKAGQEIVR